MAGHRGVFHVWGFPDRSREFSINLPEFPLHSLTQGPSPAESRQTQQASPSNQFSFHNIIKDQTSPIEMKAITVICCIFTAAAIGATIPAELENRGDSGCFPFQDPDCCITYGVCLCQNGWYYQWNEAENGCQPPWGVLSTTGEDALPGFCC
ncbi:hypothetical protein F5Y14DRAFT_413180 [Nemania sp. NC0429]|nr:hypothetical protein F5Y14DRAFT_413180 [Nemania sp. NC0429]